MSTIKTLRTEVLGLKQRELAEITKTTQATVSRWENGELAPDLEQIRSMRSYAVSRGLPWDDSMIFADGAAE